MHFNLSCSVIYYSPKVPIFNAMGKREAKLFQIAYSIAIVLSLVKISEANRIRTPDLSVQVESATQTTTPSTTHHKPGRQGHNAKTDLVTPATNHSHKTPGTPQSPPLPGTSTTTEKQELGHHTGRSHGSNGLGRGHRKALQNTTPALQQVIQFITEWGLQTN